MKNFAKTLDFLKNTVLTPLPNHVIIGYLNKRRRGMGLFRKRKNCTAEKMQEELEKTLEEINARAAAYEQTKKLEQSEAVMKAIANMKKYVEMPDDDNQK